MNSKPPSAKPDNPGIMHEVRPDEGKQKSDTATDKDAGGADLRTQYERDQSSDATGAQPQEVIRQAHDDIEAGLVDTDLRGTPGATAERQRELLEREKQRSEQNSRKG